jgi:peptidoglycan/LPS O-acetylase OafA/YrhL
MLPLGPKDWLLNAAFGAAGMAIFFSLSGFLITTKLADGQSVPDFFIRRVARILPLAYLYLTVVFLLISYNPDALLANVFFIENIELSYLSSLNGHFWSLCVELHFYLFVGLVVATFGRRGLCVVIPLCLFITALRIYDGTFITIRTPGRVDEILVGAAVALIYRRGARLPSQPFFAIGAFVAVLAASMSQSQQLQYARPYLGGLLLMAALCAGPSPLRSLLTSRPAEYIATISYALYVIHPLTMHGWLGTGGAAGKYLLKRPISFLATFALSHLSTFYYERRFIDWAKRAAQRSRNR